MKKIYKLTPSSGDIQDGNNANELNNSNVNILTDELKGYYEKAKASQIDLQLFQSHHAAVQRAVRAFDTWKSEADCVTNHSSVAQLKGCINSAASIFQANRVGGYFAMPYNQQCMVYLNCQCCNCPNKDCAPNVQYAAIKQVVQQSKHWLQKVKQYIIYNGGKVEIAPTEQLQIVKPQDAPMLTNSKKTTPTKLLPKFGKSVSSFSKNKE